MAPDTPWAGESPFTAASGWPVFLQAQDKLALESHKKMFFPFTVLNPRGKKSQNKTKHKSSQGKRHRPSAGKPGVAGCITVPLQSNAKEYIKHTSHFQGGASNATIPIFCFKN